MTNIHQFFCFNHKLSNKPILTRLRTTPPHLKYVTTLPCNLSLMTSFADNNASQSSVATHARCGGIDNIRLTANLPRNLVFKKCLKSIKIWRNYGHESVAQFFGPPCIYIRVSHSQPVVTSSVTWLRSSSTREIETWQPRYLRIAKYDNYPRESEGLCFYQRWFVCLSVCLSVCLLPR